MYDVIIIGGGPAGMAVALNTLRNGRTCLLLEKENFGGQMATSPKLENIPGIKAIAGTEYADQMFDQITEMGAEFELEDVESVTKEDEKFIVKTNYNTYESWVVVLANGCHHRKMNLPHEDELVGKGISYCAVCDFLGWDIPRRRKYLEEKKKAQRKAESQTSSVMRIQHYNTPCF